METGLSPEMKQQLEELGRQLQDPFKLRVVTLAVVAALGFLAVYRPMDTKIQVLRRDLKASQERLATLEQVESLRDSKASLLANIPENPTLNFWQEHFLVGIRESGVNLRALESQTKKIKIADRQVIYLDIEAAGSYEELYNLLAWIDNNKWFSRVLRLNFKGKNGQIEARLTVAVLVAQEKSHGA
jgi:hypothetical protein